MSEPSGCPGGSRISSESQMPLDLIAHPEGGRFREVFRSPVRVQTPDAAERCALTHI